MGFFVLVRVSALPKVRKSDIAIEEKHKGRRIISAVRRSETDQSGDGVTRALIGEIVELFPAKVEKRFFEQYQAPKEFETAAGRREDSKQLQWPMELTLR